MYCKIRGVPSLADTPTNRLPQKEPFRGTAQSVARSNGGGSSFAPHAHADAPSSGGACAPLHDHVESDDALRAHADMPSPGGACAPLTANSGGGGGFALHAHANAPSSGGACAPLGVSSGIGGCASLHACTSRRRSRRVRGGARRMRSRRAADARCAAALGACMAACERAWLQTSLADIGRAQAADRDACRCSEPIPLIYRANPLELVGYIRAYVRLRARWSAA
jgi:hypothetical protein